MRPHPRWQRQLWLRRSQLAPPLAQWLSEVGVDEKLARYLATGLVVLLITYFSIVVGELVPKRLGQLRPEAVARLVARPMEWLAALAKPFVRVLSGSTEVVLMVLGVKNRAAPRVTEEEIHALLAEGSQEGVIEEHEKDMVRNVFRLDDSQLGSLMVPRGDLVYLDATKPWPENHRIIESH